MGQTSEILRCSCSRLGYFVGALDFPPTFGKTKDGGDPLGNATSTWYVSVATRDGFMAELNGEADEIGKGLTLGWRGPSLIPELCDGGMGVAIALKNPTTMDLSAECEFDSVELPSADARAANGESLVPGINFLALRSLRITAALQPNAVVFEVGGSFHFATKSSVADSDCAKPDTDGACLTVDTSVAIGFAVGPSIILRFDFEMHGTWFEPLGLKNFAVANPKFKLGVQIYAAGPKPLELEFNIELFWRRSGNWPGSLLEKKKDGEGNIISPFPDACSGLETRACFAPDQSDEKRVGDLFIFQAAFLYEEKLPVPRFGVRFTMTAISLLDIVNMAADIAAGVAGLAGESDPPSRPTFPDGIDLFLNGIGFGFAFELSTVAEGVFQRRLYLFGSATVDFAGFGGFYFMIETELRLPAEADLPAFVADPIGELKASIKFNASVTLPLQLGEATFYGFVSPTKFEMNSSLTIDLLGFGIDFQAGIIASDGGFDARLYARAELGDVGDVFLYGRLSSDTSIGLHVKADVDLKFLAGFAIAASVAANISETEKFLRIDSAIHLGIFGKTTFEGSIATTGMDLRAKIDFGFLGLVSICGEVIAEVAGDQQTGYTELQGTDVVAECTAAPGGRTSLGSCKDEGDCKSRCDSDSACRGYVRRIALPLPSLSLPTSTTAATEIKQKWDGKVFDWGNGIVYQHSSHGGDNQKFFVEVVGSGPYFKIKVASEPDKCLDWSNSDSPADGKLYMYPCHDGDNQKWIFDGGSSSMVQAGISEAGAAYLRVKSALLRMEKMVEPAANGKPEYEHLTSKGAYCLDYNYETSKLYLHDCHKGGNQKFYFDVASKAPGSTFELLSYTGPSCVINRPGVQVFEKPRKADGAGVQYKLQAALKLKLGILGEFELTGEVSNDGVLLEAEGKLFNPITEAIKKAVHIIMGNTALADVVNNMLTSAFALRKVYVLVDTRDSSMGERRIDVKLELEIFGLSVTIPLTIKLENDLHFIPLWKYHRLPMDSALMSSDFTLSDWDWEKASDDLWSWIDGENAASKCIDDNLRTLCRSSVQSDPWLRIDMGATQNLSSVMILNREGICGSRLGYFEVWVSDGGEFTQCAAGDAAPAAPLRSTLFAPVPPDERDERSSTTSCDSGFNPGDQLHLPCARQVRYVEIRLPGEKRILNLREVYLLLLEPSEPDVHPTRDALFAPFASTDTMHPDLEPSTPPDDNLRRLHMKSNLECENEGKFSDLIGLLEEWLTFDKIVAWLFCPENPLPGRSAYESQAGEACRKDCHCENRKCGRVGNGDILECCKGELETVGFFDYCARQSKVGEPCRRDTQCENDRCGRVGNGDRLECCQGEQVTVGTADYCAKQSEIGEECRRDVQCENNCGLVGDGDRLECCKIDNFYNPSTTRDYCEAQMEVGERCDWDGQCMNDACGAIGDGSYYECCKHRRHRPFGATGDWCERQMEVGARCKYNTQCENEQCGKDPQSGEYKCCPSGMIRSGLKDWCLPEGGKVAEGGVCYGRNEECRRGSCHRIDRHGYNFRCCDVGNYYCHGGGPLFETKGDCEATFIYCDGYCREGQPC